MTSPDFRVKTPFSANGPQVGLPGRHLAGIAEAQAKSRVAGVGFLDDHQMMSLVSCVANVSRVPAAI